MPRRQDRGSVPSWRARTARISALLLIVVAGMLAVVQPAGATPTQPDVGYLNAAHQANLTIIQAGEVAKTKGRTACVRRAGAVMERDHRKLAAQELEAATQLGVGLVTIPSLAQRERLDALAAKAGTSGYDAAWLAFQRQEHEALLKLIEEELAKGTDQTVKSVARGAQPVVEMHLRMVSGSCRAETGSPIVSTGEGGQVADAERTRSRTALALLGIGVLLLLVGKQVRVRRRLVGAAAVVAALVMVFGGPGDGGQVPEAGAAVSDREAAIPPVRLTLPGYLEAPVMPVATARDGHLQVPKSTADVGWWAAGAAPGSAGGTVLLAGHVDSARGRGVFAALSKVPVGARVSVKSGDGDVHWYRIVARRTYRQSALPADLFRGAARPRLALVTCTGSYDRAAHRYSHNLVLYGVPLD
ncbi:DUF4142 domain-containing protein [Kribbella turkmenica]|uniref:DUF4142 domain-containing protein n=1 Tax=Kribbella turkmenica TaxID=2530375 RepID=A0A4R4XE93_9ACTN|nr:DUF4142 domain-containing protein [Kribbella turkmenica]TDD29141.1 DUF4142 domain-containing protein [Kribbella turkmenica]